MTPKICRQIFERFSQQNSEPTTELLYTSPFELLIAVILSAQATDLSVNKVTVRFFHIANTPRKIIALGEAKLKSYIKIIGLHNSKAKNILKTCEIIVREHKDEVPNTRKALEALPGVGRKTANVILNTLFGKLTIGVDTHIFRVSNRTKLADGKTPLIVEKQLQNIIPVIFKRYAHHWLLLHGRYFCQARHPLCQKCVIKDISGK